MSTPTTATTTASAPYRIACPACAKGLNIRPEFAGRAVKCKCGHVFKAPSPADIAEKAAAEALARGYMPAHKRVVTEDENPEPEDNALLDTYLPITLIPLGIALSLIQAAYFDKHEHHLSEVLLPTFINMIAYVGVMIVTVLGVSLFMGMSFHTPPKRTALKIAAIALIPGPVGLILDHVIGDSTGNIVGVFAAVGLYTLLIKVILRQAWEYTGVIVVVCWAIRTLVLYLIYKAQGANSGSWF